ncbi:MAG: hypothetical protein M5U24_03785 [Candidatus Kuenenia sp.]|nr:hypothetical protein [Candidatus Kuenenia sp.]MCZ7621592.1 hypothetical protein [Candidatus Kuenenia sp.]
MAIIPIDRSSNRLKLKGSGKSEKNSIACSPLPMLISPPERHIAPIMIYNPNIFFLISRKAKNGRIKKTGRMNGVL